jgi:hypothetical protein
LDVFSRTFLPLAAEAGVPLTTLGRHTPVLRRHTDPHEPTRLVAHCWPVDRPRAGVHLLVLTRQRLVITRDSRLRRRPRLYLEQPVADLDGVTWSVDPDNGSLELAFSTRAGRERFRLRPPQLRQMWRVDAALATIFRIPVRG